jgi:hypothetical protein
LALLQYAPEFNFSQICPGWREGFEPLHRANYSFSKSMVLLDNIIEVLTLSNFDTLVLIGVVLFDAGRIGSGFVNIDQAGFAVTAESLIQKSPCCLSITLSSK